MPLNQDQEDKVNQWVLAQNQSDPWQGNNPLAPAVSSPTPPKVMAEVPTDTGSQEEDKTDEGRMAKVQDSHPGVTSQDLFGAKMSDLDKYGPEQEQAVINNILQSRNSLGSRLSRAGAGLGDAIMGVAGKTSPGFLNNLTQQQESGEKLQSESIPMLQGMQAKQIAGKQALQARGAAPAAYAAIFKQLFPQMPPQQIAAVSANPDLAEKIFPGIGAIIEKQMTAEIQRQGLINNKAKIDADIANAQKQRQLEKEKMQADAQAKLAGEGVWHKATHIFDPAEKALKETAGLNSHPQDAEAISWAKANPNDPKAKKILSLNGI